MSINLVVIQRHLQKTLEHLIYKIQPASRDYLVSNVMNVMDRLMLSIILFYVDSSQFEP
jgi:hypothetical protein